MSATVNTRPVTVREKRFDTLRARFALLGACFYQIQDDYGRDAYLLTKGHSTREFPSLDEAEGALEEVDAP